MTRKYSQVMQAARKWLASDRKWTRRWLAGDSQIFLCPTQYVNDSAALREKNLETNGSGQVRDFPFPSSDSTQQIDIWIDVFENQCVRHIIEIVKARKLVISDA